MIPDYYDPRKVGELFLEDPAWIAKAIDRGRLVRLGVLKPETMKKGSIGRSS